MKIKLLFTLLLIAFCNYAQETTVTTSMGAGYANQVFYKLSTETENTYPANAWDIAFLRVSSMDLGIRINDANGIEVFEASNNPTDWENIDIADEASWTKLYNSDTEWNMGAFQKGSATYGWGEYNIATHHVVGTVIFVLKYADGTYKKFINEDYFGGYTFKYATWDGTQWSDDKTATISNTSNPNNEYNYYSLVTDQEVIAAPATSDWDIKFTRFFTELDSGAGDGSTVMYLVTGVLHGNQVTVAEEDDNPQDQRDISSLDFKTEINTIGHDWKAFSFSDGFVVDPNKSYYIKYHDDTVYKLQFNSFTGSSTGDLEFNFEDVTQVLDTKEVQEGVTFGMYPNPSKDKKLNIIYDNKVNSSENEIALYAINGARVYESNLNNAIGFYNKTLNLEHLPSGIYTLQFSSDKHITTKKIVLQ